MNGRKKRRGKSEICTLRKHSHALIAWSPLDNGDTLSKDSGVTGVVVLLVAKAKRKASSSEKRVQKTGLTDSLRSTHLAAVLNHSELVWVRKRDFVSLTYGGLRLSSRWGCSGSEASNRHYIENIRLGRRSNQGCHKTSREKAENWFQKK